MSEERPPTPHTITKIDFSATDDCQLRCKFCYNTPRKKGHWDVARAWKALEFLVAQPRNPFLKKDEKRRLDLIMLGGEPLLVGEEILDFVEEARKKYGPDIFVGCSPTTNLVAITKKWLARAKAMHVPPHCSIDGYPDVHDMFRKFPNGQGSSGVVMRHARWVLDAFPAASMRATMTPENIEYMAQSVSWFAKFGFTDISFSMATGTKWTKDSLAELDRQVQAVADWWVQALTNGVNPKVNWLAETLKKIWNPTRNWHVCNASVSRVALATDGRLWPCHYFVGCDDERMCLGSIEKGVSEQGERFRQRMWWAKNREIHRDAGCQDCPAVNTCDKHCLHAAYVDTGDVLGRPHWFCAMVQSYWRAAMRAHEALITSGNRWYLQIYGGMKVPPVPKGQKAPRPRSKVEMLAKVPLVKGTPMPGMGQLVPAEMLDQATAIKTAPPKTPEKPEKRAIHAATVETEPKPPSTPPQTPEGRRSAESAISGYKPKSALVVLWDKKGCLLATAQGLKMAGVHVRTLRRDDNEWQYEAAKMVGDADPPDWMVIFQRLYPNIARTIQKVLARETTKTRVLTMDFGLIRHYAEIICDPRGDNAQSEVANGGFDMLASKPTQLAALEAELPRAREWAESLREGTKAVEDHHLIRQIGDRPFAVFYGQQSRPDMVLIYDAPKEFHSPALTAQNFVAECRKADLVPVVKPHPIDPKWVLKPPNLGDAIVFSSEQSKNNAGIVAWLNTHAKAVVLINSTIVFEALAVNAPIIQIGRGWCSGNNILREDGGFKSLHKTNRLTGFDYERRLRFLALMLSRQRTNAQLRDPKQVIELFQFFDALEHEEPVCRCEAKFSKVTGILTEINVLANTEEEPLPEEPKVGRETPIVASKLSGQKFSIIKSVEPADPHEVVAPILTTVWLPDEKTRDNVRQLLERSNLGPRTLVIDRGGRVFPSWAEGFGLNVIHTPGGQEAQGTSVGIPLGLDALPKDDHKWIWMIEQDVELDPDTQQKVAWIASQVPNDVAALYLETVDEQGLRTHPADRDWEIAVEKDAVVTVNGRSLPVLTHANFCAALWRESALRQVKWDKCPKHRGCDSVAWRQLRERGWRALALPGCKAIHYCHSWGATAGSFRGPAEKKGQPAMTPANR